MHISYILSYKKKLVSALLAPPIVAYASIVLRGGVDVKSKTMLLLFFIFLYNSYKIYHKLPDNLYSSNKKHLVIHLRKCIEKLFFIPFLILQNIT